VWWHTLIIPTPPGAEIRRIMVWGQPGQKVSENPSQQLICMCMPII
jgi:hypothetical protein